MTTSTHPLPLRHLLAEPPAQPPADRLLLRVLDPATDEPVSAFPVGSEAEVDRAVAAARRAAAAWRATPPAERGSMVAAAADAVAAARDELAELTTREMGRPLAEAYGGVDAAVGTLREQAVLGPLHRGRSLQGSLGAADAMRHRPRGVVGVITPWNDPVAVAAGLLGAALVTGNAVVHKPSERTPATGLRLAEAIASVLPPGVLQVLLGDASTGRAVAAHPGVDTVALVGSSGAARDVAVVTAARGAHSVCEGGGKDPLVVDAGVDPAWAAAQAARGAFTNAGQLCTAVERIYVHRAVADDVIAALVAEAQRLVVGPGLDPATTMGPLVDSRHRQAVHAHVAAALAGGARALTGGAVPDGPGSFYPPTVLVDVPADSPVLVDETFGPVAPVVVVDSFAEGLRQAAQSRYGLAATVLTPSIEHAHRAYDELPVGTVKVNAVFGGAPGGSAQPRGDSGHGFGYGPELLHELTTTTVSHVSPYRP